MDAKIRIQTLETELAAIKEECAKLKRENEALLKEKSSPNRYIDGIWDDIDVQCRQHPDYVKSLVRNGTINVTDVDPSGRTILIIAAHWGAYELVQLCLNLGANIHHKDNNDQSALDNARNGSWYHVEQLLLFSEMNANVGHRIQQTADTINKQNGIAENIMNELSTYDETTKQFFQDTMIDLMTKIISKKQSFSDELLNLCLEFEKEALTSNLWNQILKTCENIIGNDNKRDWFYFKNFILPSTIWFKEMNSERFEDDEKEDTKYLYYKLLKLVDIESNKQLNELEDNLNEIANKNKNDWDMLITWDLPQEYESIRQDIIPNGITSQYTDSQLFGYSSAQFNTHRFYDYNEYLPQLILLAQIVDQDFQISVQKIFNIDENTKMGYITNHNLEEKKENNINNIQLIQGPVKLMGRARSKAEIDYANEQYPTSACVLDLNRCSLIFTDISSLLSALKLFTNKVKYYQSGNIIGIVRDKNGFTEYIKEVQYADIKLNVLIKGKNNNIIGEVQFLLKTMKNFKDKAHNLYSVQRQKEYVDNSVSSILPMLLDSNKQTAVAGNMGDIKALCGLMAITNKTDKDLLKLDKRGESILNNICAFGINKAFNFLKSISDKELFFDRLFYDSNSGTCIEAAIKDNRVTVLNNILSIAGVKQKCENDEELYKLVCYAFAYSNKDMIDFILSEFSVSNEKISTFISYKPQETDKAVGRNFKIISQTVGKNTLDILKYLVTKIGEKVFVDGVFIPDGWNVNGIEKAIWFNKMENIQYCMSFNDIKNKYSNNRNLLWRLMFWLFSKGTETMIDYVLNELNISNQQIVKCLHCKYAKTQQKFQSNCWEYHNYTIFTETMRTNSLNVFKKLASIIGREEFIESVFKSNSFNISPLEICVRDNKLEIMKFLMTFNEIHTLCLTDNYNQLWRLIYWLFVRGKEDMIDFVLNELQISNEQIIELIGYKYKKTTQTVDVNGWQYHDYTIITEIAAYNAVIGLKKLVRIIGEKTFARHIFIADKYNVNPIEHCIMKKNVKMMKYIMSFAKIKKICLNNKELLFRIIWCIHKTSDDFTDESMSKYIVKILKLDSSNNGKLKELQTWNKEITDDVISNLLNQ